MKELMIFLNAASAAAPQRGLDYIQIISQSSLIVKLVLIILLFFSVMSWAIIIYKMLEYSNARKNSESFLNTFRRKKNFSEILKYATRKRNSPLAEIFRQGYKELSLQMSPKESAGPAGAINIKNIERALIRASNSQIHRFERLNGFIATTAAVTPFIGLFGTVWGIMQAFNDIGVNMDANLATVAPGIAEALIATALGLFAAIPAVIFYNYLINKLKVQISTMEDFINEFLNISQRLG
jgi:biopolymer transport protein TolQ